MTFIFLSPSFANAGIGPRTSHACHLPNSFQFIINQHLRQWLTSPWSRILLEKLICSQLIKQFPAFYELRRFITAFRSARHLSLSWARSIQSMSPTSHFLKIHLKIIPHMRLGLPSGLFPSCPPTWGSNLKKSNKTNPVVIYLSLQIFVRIWVTGFRRYKQESKSYA
jgi:hypothetical protein